MYTVRAHIRTHAPTHNTARVLTRMRSRSDDARAWVEVLEDGVQIPPNLHDCHWRLVLVPPRRCAGLARGDVPGF